MQPNHRKEDSKYFGARPFQARHQCIQALCVDGPQLFWIALAAGPIDESAYALFAGTSAEFAFVAGPIEVVSWEFRAMFVNSIVRFAFQRNVGSCYY